MNWRYGGDPGELLGLSVNCGSGFSRESMFGIRGVFVLVQI